MDLSIIIVSYNTSSDLKNCLNSIYQYTHDLSFEVIVVDNASSDGSVAMLKTLFPQVKVIESGRNLGFGTANNLGVKAAKGEYILLLNPDILLFNNALKLSLDEAKKRPDLGALTCRLLFSDKTIQPSGGYFPTLPRLFAWHTAVDEIPFLNRLIKPIHPSASFYKNSFEPDWITGAFMLIPKLLFEQLKGFDEKIFMYGEELEFCYRVKKSGFRIYYLAHPSIIHLQAKASSSHFALINEVKGIKYFFKKHHPAWQKPLVDLAFFIGSLLRLLLFGIILRNDTKKATYLELLHS